MIHQFAVDAASQETLQEHLRAIPAEEPADTLLDLQAVLPKPATPAPGVQNIRAAAIPEIDIGRAATHLRLFDSASVIDAIPDAAILANERNQRPMPGLAVLSGEQLPAGRAAKLSRKRVGKFGWKANIGDLSEFVRVACAIASWGSAIPCRPSRHRSRNQSIVPAGSISRTSSAIKMTAAIRN